MRNPGFPSCCRYRNQRCLVSELHSGPRDNDDDGARVPSARAGNWARASGTAEGSRTETDSVKLVRSSGG